MPKPTLNLEFALQEFPVPNPPYSEEASKVAYALYLAYHQKTDADKTGEELFYQFEKEYQGTFSRPADYVFHYLSSPRHVLDRNGIAQKASQLYPVIPEIKQGPYSTTAPWNLFNQFAKEWFHKIENHEHFISYSSSVFLGLRPASFPEFHVFIKHQ